jgi:hypothetical protein
MSDQRAADGGVMECVKKAKINNPSFYFPNLTVPGVCGKLAGAGYGIFPDRVNFPQSPTNLGGLSPAEKSDRQRGTKRTLAFGVKRCAEIFGRSDNARVVKPISTEFRFDC